MEYCHSEQTHTQNALRMDHFINSIYIMYTSVVYI